MPWHVAQAAFDCIRNDASATTSTLLDFTVDSRLEAPDGTGSIGVDLNRSKAEVKAFYIKARFAPNSGRPAPTFSNEGELLHRLDQRRVGVVANAVHLVATPAHSQDTFRRRLERLDTADAVQPRFELPALLLR